MNIIPRDARNLIYYQLDGVTLSRCKRVCKLFYQDISRFPFWKNIFSRENPGFIPEKEPQIGWEKYYKQQTLLKSNLNHPTINKYKSIKESCIEYCHFLGQKIYVHSLKDYKSKFLSYDLFTGNLVKKFKTIPKSAFPKELDEDVPLKYDYYGIFQSFKKIDSRHFLIVSQNGLLLSIWDSLDNTCVFAQNNVLEGMVYAQGSQVIYFTNKGFLEVWDYTTKTLIKQNEGMTKKERNRLTSVTGYYSGNCQLVGNMLFVLMGSKYVMAYDLEKGNLKYTLSFLDKDDKYIETMKAAENYLTIRTKDGEVIVYEPQTGEIIQKISIKGKCTWLYVSAEIDQNKLIVDRVDDSHSIRCWNLETGKIDLIIDFGCDIHSWNIAGDRLFVLTIDDTCRLIDIKESKLLFEKKLTSEGAYDLQMNEKKLKIYRDQNHMIIHGLNTCLFWDVQKMQAMQLGTRIHFDGRILVVKSIPGYDFKDLSYDIKDLGYTPPSNIFKRIGKTAKSFFIGNRHKE